MGLLEDIRRNMYDGEETKVVELVQQAIDEGLPPQDIMDKALIAGLRDTGDGFERGEKFIPEMLLSAEAMKASMELLKPLLLDTNGQAHSAGKIVLATVEGDVHDIGLSLVGMMLETAGYEVRFMGADVPMDDIIEAVKEDKPMVVGLSALLSNTMDLMPDIIDGLKKEGLRDSVKVIVGGAPVKQDFADEIGADGWAYDAAGAVPMVKKLTDNM